MAERNAAFAALTESMRQLQRTKDTYNVNMRVLKVKYERCIEAKELLLEKHYQYGEKNKTDLQAEEMTEWLNPKMDAAEDLLDEVFILLDEDNTRISNEQTQQEKENEEDAEEARKQTELAIIRKQSETDELLLNENINALRATLADEQRNTRDDVLATQASLKEIDLTLEASIKSWNLLKGFLTTDGERDDVFNKEMDARKLVSDVRLKANVFIQKFSQTNNISDDAASISSANTTSTSADRLAIKLQKINLPTFSGNSRSFARFKGDFNRIVKPSYPDTQHLTYVLKEQCLKGPAKALVENIVSIDEIWPRLESKYGRTTDIVRMVLNDVKKLSFQKTDKDAALITLVDTLEKGIQDLTLINACAEISTAYTVSIIEEKLPRRILEKWLELETEEVKTSVTTVGEVETEDEGMTGASRFDKLIQFLKNERRQAERMIQLHSKDREKDEKEGKDKHKGDKGDKYRSNVITGKPSSSTHNNSCLVHPNGNHLTRKCRVFQSKTAAERGKIVKDSNGCKFCLSLSHVGQPCPFESQWGPCNVDNCKAFHSRLLHGCGIPEFSMHMQVMHLRVSKNDEDNECTTPQTFTYSNKNNTLLLVQEIRTLTDIINAFWDDGSSLSLVSRGFVRRARLTGVRMSYELVTAGDVHTIHHTTLYEITLLDRKGNKHVIQAFEMESICGHMEAPDMEELCKAFPSLNQKDVERRAGEVELLIGNNYAPLHPIRIDTNEGLVLYQSQFGTGRILGGSHHSIEVTSQISSMVRHFSNLQLCNLRVARETNGIDCFTADDLGVKVPPRCPSCLGCKTCSFETHQMSRIDQYELTVIRKNLVLNALRHRFTTTYPFKEDPSILQDNRAQALKLMEKTEKRLSRSDSHAQNYCEQFDDFVKRGVLSVISEQEMREYKGPVFYVNHHEVLKAASASTPLRLVVNSSLRYKGVGLNDILMKGPNCLQDLLGIQLRFRQHSYVLVCDLKKYYHSVYTTQVEKHVRRVLWRNMKFDEPPTTYGFETVTFGDKPAGAICSAAIKETAEVYSYIDSDAAEKIKEDAYVDDIVTGAESKERIKEMEETITEILSKGGFTVKGFVSNGDRSAKARALLGTGIMGRVLGISWDPSWDEFCVSVRINISKKVRGQHTLPDLAYEEIPRILIEIITRRILLGITNSCYDIYGLIAPLLIQLKIALRYLFSKELNLGWDDPISQELKAEWMRMLQLLKTAESVRFPRCIRPNGAIGEPILIMCNDGSKDAMCCTAHVRWELESGGYECVLLAAKSRVTPLKKTTIPRVEMRSAVMSVRLSKTIQHHMSMKFKETVHILDSMCTLATLHKDTMALKEVMGNSVSEILETTETGQWYHTASEENVSDLATRCEATVDDILPTSDWQRGRPWMSLPRDKWPTTQDFGAAKVPDEELLKTINISYLTTVLPVIDMQRFEKRSYQYLVHVAAIVMKVAQAHSFGIDGFNLSALDLDAGEKFCVLESMKHTKKDMESGKLTSLRPQVDIDGVIVLSSRADEGLKHHYNQERFPILTYHDPLAYLWIKQVHNEDHSGTARTVSKSRRKYWIVRARKLADKVKSRCYRCRILDKLMAEQQMAPLPLNRQKMSPPFNITSMDMIGPLTIKDTVKQRTVKKVWVVIFNCAATRAIHLDLTEDYGTDAILHTIRRFVCIRGCPTEIQSDQGSQLIAAANDIADLVRDWNWEPVHAWASSQRIKWTVVPAEGQHQNGLSESLVKSVKRTIKHKFGPHVFTFSQLQTGLFEIGNIINSRPIGITSGSDPSDPQPLTPNDLLLGRSSGEVPQGPFDSGSSITKRFRFLQQLVDEWWQSWYQTVLPTLVPSYKWLIRHRNVQVGDVCLIRYGKDKRATYRLGRVQEVKKGSDGLTRKVTLKYKLPTEKVFRTVDRPIQGIAVIVPVEEQEAQEFPEPTEEKLSAVLVKKGNADAVSNTHETDTYQLNPNASVFQSNIY